MTVSAWNPELLPEYEDNSAIIFVLDEDLKIVYCNAEWDRFALANGGAHLIREHQIGRSVEAITPEVLRPFYTHLYSTVFSERREMDWVYECSGDKTFRRFHMHLTRKDVVGGRSFIVVFNSLVLEMPQQRHVEDIDTRALRGKHGLITMCSHCRRTRMPGAGERWVWVPALVRQMPLEVTHGLCLICFDIHFGR